MSTVQVPEIMEAVSIPRTLLPDKWEQKLVEKQKIGGVVYVFLSGKNKTELRGKVTKLRKFCKDLYEQSL